MYQLTHAYRNHLPLGDLEFVAACLGGSETQTDAIFKLLTDPATVDEILDQPKLIETVLDSIEQLRLSSRLYFYLVTRHSLKRAGLDDADLADYLSGVLDEQLALRGRPGRRPPVFYVVDWLNELEKQPREKHFQLYVMAGNYLLFLTGIFPNRIHERRRRRGAPGLGFYEDIGRFSFENASRHARNANRDEAIYRRIADRFSDLRSALNDASDRLLHLD
ncbi:MAG: hypothetical protein ACOC4K_03035 [Verrucomicrobiota bacterium]